MANIQMTAQDKRFTVRLMGVVLLGLLVLATILIFFNKAFGWFAHNTGVDATGMSVQAGDTIFPQVKAWRFDISHDNGATFVENGEDFEKDGAWHNALDTSTPDANDLVSVQVASAALGDSGTEVLRYISLHLGTVDNLLDLSDDNCFFLRLDVSEDVIASLGSSFAASYSVEDLTFYSADGSEVSQQELGNDTFDRLMSLVDIDCAVSATAYDMTTSTAAADAVKALFADNRETTAASVTPGTNYKRVVRNAAADTPIYSPGDATPYYVYVRLRPDLANCFKATQDISAYMPCQLLFDINLRFTFAA